jgi:acyl-CoA thioesterase
LAVAINAGISYFRATRSGTIIAEAEEVSINPKLATYVIRVKDEIRFVVSFSGPK